MLKLLERHIASIGRQLVLVAPAEATLPDAFRNVALEPTRHRDLVRKMQSFRGSVYLQEGNLKPHQLTLDGRHETPEDAFGWHLLMVAAGGEITSCSWYRVHEGATSMDDLRVRTCPLAKSEEWGGTLKGAVETEIARAHAAGLRYSELGGWAILKERRGSAEGLMMALAMYSLGRMLGGALGITTANVAHSCSAILRRFGGAPLEHEGKMIPPYFDPRYNTEIELLRFDSRNPNTKYVGLIDRVKDQLATVSVIARPAEVPVVERRHAPRPPARRVVAA